MKKSKSLLPPRKQPLFRQIESGAGRENIADCLVATGNPRATRLLDMMLDPAYEALSFGQLCSRAGLSGGEVLRLICQRQLAEGMIRACYHLPDIMENLALDAMGRNEPCATCCGEGILGTASCRRCGGSGSLRFPGDMRRIRLALEMFGILPCRES
jgi:hypothetical protein